MSEDKTTRRKALKTTGGMLASAGLIGSATVTTAEPSDDLSRDRPEEVWEYIIWFGKLSEKEQRREWQTLSKSDKDVFRTALSPGEILTDVTERNVPNSDTHYDSKEVSNTTKVKGGLDLVVVAEFNHFVTWDYSGYDVKNVNQDATHDIKRDLLSFWDFLGIGQDKIQPQADWTDAFMSGKFSWRLTKYGELQRQTAYSEIRVKEDGSWSVEKSTT